MRILKVKSQIPGIKSVVLFTEDKREDYLYNHQLSIVSDLDDDEYEQNIRKYDTLPDKTNVSDRTCWYKSINVKRT
jgi:hypothetical protein